MKTTKRGFTLIELLVVVLIVGILSSVALPQYQKAVEKSRMSEALIYLNSFRTGVLVYVMANGFDRKDFLGVSPDASLDLDFNLSCAQGDDFCSSKDFKYDVDCTTTYCAIRAIRVNNSTEEYELRNSLNEDFTWTNRCFTRNRGLGKAICKNFEKEGWIIEDK